MENPDETSNGSLPNEPDLLTNGDIKVSYSDEETFESTQDPFAEPPPKRSKSLENRSYENVGGSGFDYLNSSSSFQRYSDLEQDADVSFLMSVLPDMKEMTSAQKRKFKIQILKVAGDILSGKNS